MRGTTTLLLKEGKSGWLRVPVVFPGGKLLYSWGTPRNPFGATTRKSGGKAPPGASEKPDDKRKGEIFNVLQRYGGWETSR